MQIVPDRAAMRELFKLAIPIVTVQVGLMLMGVVDTIMVGHISAAALAAVALGNLIFFAIGIFCVGVIMALDPVISQAVGAGDHDDIARGIQRGFVISVMLTVFMSAILPFSGWAMTAFKQPPEVVPIATTYVNYILPSVLPFLAFTVLRQSLQAMGHLKPIVWTIVAANLLNVLLNWILIFGKFGLEPMGVAGAALATTISRVVMIVALLLAGWPYLHTYLERRDDIFSFKPLMRMLIIGAPIGIAAFLEFANFAGIALLMGILGTNEMAAHQVAINIASLTFMVPMGIAAAASVLIGNSIGRGDDNGARRFARAAIFFAVAFMTLSACVMLTVPDLLASAYTDDAAVLAIAVTLLPIAGVFQIFDGLQVVGSGVLRGAGDTRVPMMIGLGGFWLIGMPISIYFGLYTNARALGLWWGFVAGLAAVAIFLLYRIRWKFAGQLRRVVVDDHHVELGA